MTALDWFIFGLAVAPVVGCMALTLVLYRAMMIYLRDPDDPTRTRTKTAQSPPNHMKSNEPRHDRESCQSERDAG